MIAGMLGVGRFPSIRYSVDSVLCRQLSCKQPNERNEMTLHQIGEVFVDSGTLQVGDPCYERDTPTWDAVCERLSESALIDRQGFDEPWGAGMGVLVGAGADGCFPVYLKVDRWGNPTEIRIVLQEVEDD